MLGKRIVIDTSKCTACRACMVSCKQWHSLPAEDTTFTGSYQNPKDLSGATLTLIRFTETVVDEKLKFLFFNDRCRHCEFPNCKPSCPLGAIKKKGNGGVYIKMTVCNPLACTSAPYPALRPCQLGCPFKVSGDGLGIPRWKFEKDGALVGSKMKKCDFCYNRYLTSQKVPAKSRKPSCATPLTQHSKAADFLLFSLPVLRQFSS